MHTHVTELIILRISNRYSGFRKWLLLCQTTLLTSHTAQFYLTGHPFWGYSFMFNIFIQHCPLPV